jgi:hypothetical protein
MAKTVAKTPKTHPKWSISPFFVQHFSLRIFLVGIIFGLQNPPKSDNITQKANDSTPHITELAYYNTHEVNRQTNKTLFECARDGASLALANGLGLAKRGPCRCSLRSCKKYAHGVALSRHFDLDVGFSPHIFWPNLF